MLISPVLEIHACQPKLPLGSRHPYFLPAFTFAHLARCAAAIFRRAAADMVRLTGTGPAAFADRFAHRAFCARLMRLRAEADIVRLGSV
jgi:hypothetical protein